MSLAIATVAVTDWIAAQFAGQEDLDDVGVYVAAASDDTPRPLKGVHGPYITLRHLGSNDHLYIGGAIAGTSVVIEVTAWDEGTTATALTPIVGAIHSALHGQRGSADGVVITGCSRQAPVERQIPEDDRLYTQLGGEYRVRASAA